MSDVRIYATDNNNIIKRIAFNLSRLILVQVFLNIRSLGDKELAAPLLQEQVSWCFVGKVGV